MSSTNETLNIFKELRIHSFNKNLEPVLLQKSHYEAPRVTQLVSWLHIAVDEIKHVCTICSNNAKYKVQTARKVL